MPAAARRLPRASPVRAARSSRQLPGARWCGPRAQELEAEASTPQAAESPFQVTVTDPVRQGEGMNAYMVYHVNTKTSLPQFQLGEFRVGRRYRDFDWLFHQLVDKWPGVIVPPLPEKAIAGRVTGVGFTPEFIESRRKALELFLRRVTSHAELQQAECVQVFLEASEDALEAAKASSKAASGRQGNWGQLFSEGWQGLRSYYGKSLGGMGMSGSAAEGGVDRQCAELKAYVARVEAQLGALHRAVERLVKRHRAASAGMNDLGLAFAQLGTNADNDLSRALASSLAGVGVTCDSAARTLGTQADAEADALEEPLRDALRLLQQCRHAIHAREYSFHAWQAACSTRDARRSRAARTIGADAGDSKAQQMASEVSEGEALVRQTQAEYEQIKERTNREITRFQEVRESRFGPSTLWLGGGPAPPPSDQLSAPHPCLPRHRSQEVMHDVKSVLSQFVRLQTEGTKRVCACTVRRGPGARPNRPTGISRVSPASVLSPSARPPPPPPGRGVVAHRTCAGARAVGANAAEAQP